MFISSKSCKIRRISSLSDIKLILKNNELRIQSSHGILVGSRAARYFLPHFRGTSTDNNADWNAICAAQFLLGWLTEESDQVQTIEMVVPKLKEGYKLDLYVECTSHDGARHKFTVPRSSLSYTAYLLEDVATWTVRSSLRAEWSRKRHCLFTATVRLLLILKRSMLFYAYQWMKTAQDYRQLVTVPDYSTDEDTSLCELVVGYNEQLYGKRSRDVDTFQISPGNMPEKNIIIDRTHFAQQTKNQQRALIYHAAVSMFSTGSLLEGLEYMCTQGPLWLADYIMNNWMEIQNDKFKHLGRPTTPKIQLEVDSHCLFVEIPEKANQCILQHIETTADFYAMQLVCKRWNTVLNQAVFWQHCYEFQYGDETSPENLITNWKLMYFVRREAEWISISSPWKHLVEASHRLRQYTATDLYRLWEELTHQDQQIELSLISHLDFILSNAFYYQMSESSNQYSARLIVNGLGNVSSQWRVHVTVRMRKEGSSRFSDDIEELVIEWTLDNKMTRSSTMIGPHLIGFDFGIWGYLPTESRLLSSIPSEIHKRFPTGLITCLSIIMVHPSHRLPFINYLKNLEYHCRERISQL